MKWQKIPNFAGKRFLFLFFSLSIPEKNIHSAFLYQIKLAMAFLFYDNMDWAGYPAEYRILKLSGNQISG